MRFGYYLHMAQEIEIHFQFSLWDSTAGYVDFGFYAGFLSILFMRFQKYDSNQLAKYLFSLSILFMRFEENGTVILELNFNFQFSLWDSTSSFILIV